MGTRQGNTQPAPDTRYRLHWGAGFTPVPDETHDGETIADSGWYDAKELKRIARLKPGATLDLSDHHPEGYTPRVMEHTVTRLS